MRIKKIIVYKVLSMGPAHREPSKRVNSYALVTTHMVVPGHGEPWMSGRPWCYNQ